MFPDAPPRLSMMTCWPMNSANFGCRMRATKSDEPPGAFGTIMRSGRDGKVSAGCAAVAAPEMSRNGGGEMLQILRLHQLLEIFVIQPSDYALEIMSLPGLNVTRL